MISPRRRLKRVRHFPDPHTSMPRTF